MLAPVAVAVIRVELLPGGDVAQCCVPGWFTVLLLEWLRKRVRHPRRNAPATRAMGGVCFGSFTNLTLCRAARGPTYGGPTAAAAAAAAAAARSSIS